jgi:hypothetical protein
VTQHDLSQLPNDWLALVAVVYAQVQPHEPRPWHHPYICRNWSTNTRLTGRVSLRCFSRSE